MIPLFDKKVIREADNYAINSLGIPSIVLMENAAISCYNAILNEFSFNNSNIGILCGKGNNAGDGFAIARHFANNGYNVKVLLISNENELKGDALINYNILKKLSEINPLINIKNYKDIKSLKFLEDCDLVIDAILGSGFSGTLDTKLAEIILEVNKFNSIKIAVDIPTGLDVDLGFGETIFNADLTITLGEFKKGLFFGKGSTFSGKVVKGDIGLPKEYFDNINCNTYIIEPEDALNALPTRNKDLNKYSSGKVMVIGSSLKYPGAGVLCANSSLITGAGATSLAVSNNLVPIIFSSLYEVTIKTYSNNYFDITAIDELKEELDKVDVFAIGCGLDRNEETIKACEKIIKNYKNKIIVGDADFIFALSKLYWSKLNLSNFILTPHLGEFATLINRPVNEINKNLLGYGKEFVTKTNAYLVLKGSPTIIFFPNGEVFINSAGNSGMAKFGMGDVLSGVIASYIAQSKDIENSLISAVYLHSLSADLLAKEETEFGILAHKVAQNISKAINFLRSSV